MIKYQRTRTGQLFSRSRCHLMQKYSPNITTECKFLQQASLHIWAGDDVFVLLFFFSSWVKSLKGCYWKWDKGFMVMFLALRSIHHHANNAKTLYTHSYKAWSTCPLLSGLLGWDASSSAVPGEQAVSVLGPVLHLAFKYFCAGEVLLLLMLLLNFPLACWGWKETSTTAECFDDPGTCRPAPQ